MEERVGRVYALVVGRSRFSHLCFSHPAGGDASRVRRCCIAYYLLRSPTAPPASPPATGQSSSQPHDTPLVPSSAVSLPTARTSSRSSNSHLLPRLSPFVQTCHGLRRRCPRRLLLAAARSGGTVVQHRGPAGPHAAPGDDGAAGGQRGGQRAGRRAGGAAGPGAAQLQLPARCRPAASPLQPHTG